MFHLLTTRSIFMPIGNDCLVQLAGMPMSELEVIRSVPQNSDKGKRRATAQDGESERPKKRRKNDQPKPQPCKKT